MNRSVVPSPCVPIRRASMRRPPDRRKGGVALVLCVATVLLTTGCGPSELSVPDSPAVAISAWPAYAGDPGGQRSAPLVGITPDNVATLAPAWTHHHGDLAKGRDPGPSQRAFENTPILADDTLYLCTPFNRVIALDPVTGVERWVFDPEIDLSGRYANQLICRGVSFWRDTGTPPSDACSARIFTATNDARLIAIDAATGLRCAGFGRAGEIDLNPGAGPQKWQGEYQVTSPPAVAGDVVVVGSAISDNARIDAPSGVVRGFDARTGALRWAWDLAPPGFDPETGMTSPEGYALGTPNVWAPMSVDEARGLVFVPTGNAAPDYYHGTRAEMNHYGSSVVALHADRGELAWHFQTVHDDLWDFDVPAQPVLTTIEFEGRRRDVAVQTTKTGLVFVLDRDTGEPVHAVEERAVPTSNAAPGEVISPTQPFPKIPRLTRDDLAPEEAWGLTPWDRGACRNAIESLHFEGIYTPPSEQGSIMYPGNAGGSNWGGLAIDPQRQIAIARISDLPWIVKLIPREAFAATKAAHPDQEISPQAGTPYGMWRRMLMSPLGLPCNAPPWGTLVAIDLRKAEVLWQVPHGSVNDVLPVPLPLSWTTWGVPGVGGPMVTEGGLVFIAAAIDDYVRAFSIETGEELWRGRLPAGGQASPMGYRVEFEDGSARDYVVIAAGGHARAGTRQGDSLVAFALEE